MGIGRGADDIVGGEWLYLGFHLKRRTPSVNAGFRTKKQNGAVRCASPSFYPVNSIDEPNLFEGFFAGKNGSLSGSFQTSGFHKELKKGSSIAAVFTAGPGEATGCAGFCFRLNISNRFKPNKPLCNYCVINRFNRSIKC